METPEFSPVPSMQEGAKKNQEVQTSESDRKMNEADEKLTGALQAVFERHPNITTGASFRYAELSQIDAVTRDLRQALSMNEDPVILMVGNTNTTGLNVRISVGTGQTRRAVCSFNVLSRDTSRIVRDFQRHGAGPY